jgi:hypothetical protein
MQTKGAQLMNNLIECQSIATENSFPSNILGTITEKTSCEEYDRMLAIVENYLPTHGGAYGTTPLFKAALKGNIQLITHIVTTGGSAHLHVGNLASCTPIFGALLCKNEDHALFATMKLYKLGAVLNTVLSRGSFLDGAKVEKGTTLLWIAVEKTNNLKLIKFLLLCKASSGLVRLSYRGAAKIGQATQKLFTDKLPLLAHIDPKSPFSQLPKELLHHICSFTWDCDK